MVRILVRPDVDATILNCFGRLQAEGGERTAGATANAGHYIHLKIFREK